MLTIFTLVLWSAINYPITPFLSPPRIYAHRFKSEFKPTGLKYESIFSIRENK